MIEQDSIKLKKRILLTFTKELIRNTGAGEIFRLKKILEEKENFQISIEEKEKLIKHELYSPIKSEPTMGEILKGIKTKKLNEKLTNRFIKKINKPVLRIPETHLPLRFQYLKPVQSKMQIDLGKLNPLINDFGVQTIECDGANENIVVKGKMGQKQTEIILSKEEIDEIIKRFSETTKIPINEGIFKVATGKLILNSIISKTLGSKFIIKKIKNPIPAPRPF